MNEAVLLNLEILQYFISEFSRSGGGHLLLSKSHLTELGCDVTGWKYVGEFFIYIFFFFSSARRDPAVTPA